MKKIITGLLILFVCVAIPLESKDNTGDKSITIMETESKKVLQVLPLKDLILISQKAQFFNMLHHAERTGKVSFVFKIYKNDTIYVEVRWYDNKGQLIKRLPMKGFKRSLKNKQPNLPNSPKPALQVKG